MGQRSVQLNFLLPIMQSQYAYPSIPAVSAKYPLIFVFASSVDIFSYLIDFDIRYSKLAVFGVFLYIYE